MYDIVDARAMPNCLYCTDHKIVAATTQHTILFKKRKAQTNNKVLIKKTNLIYETIQEQQQNTVNSVLKQLPPETEVMKRSGKHINNANQ